MPNGVARDRQDDVRVDGHHGGIDHLDAPFREALSQQYFQHAWQAEFEIRVTHRRRFAKNEHTQGIG
jgi:hypothetical protein